MRSPHKMLKGTEKLLFDLAELEYLTAEQAAKVGGYKETSLPYVRKTLKALVTSGFACTLPRQLVTQPLLYTPTTSGYTYASALGVPHPRRVRPVDERDKAKNTLFVQHTVAISDVLIAAKLLAKTHPLIELSRLYTERSLKRKIAVPLPDNRTCYIEPDAACEFLLTETWHEPPQT
jgi:hypothetical protein